MSSAISRCPRKSCSVRLMGALLCLLLAQRCGDIGIGAAIVRLALATGDQDFGRALFGGIGVEALALAIAFGLAELVGRRLAVRRTIARCRTRGSPRHHGAGPG